MRNSFYYSILSFLVFNFFEIISGSNAENISVSVTNLRNNKGHVLISMFREGAGYPDEPQKAFRKAKATINNKMASITFEAIPYGRYAIAILHDENDDMKMNKNFFGLPREGYGFSNNVMGTLGPPSFGKSSFLHNPGLRTSIIIKTRY